MSEFQDQQSAYRVALATDLRVFLERAFLDLDQRDKLIITPYVELLIDRLQKMRSGKTRRLIINLPPRHLKSILCSVVFPAWLLANDPRMRIAVVSHGLSLARDLALRS